MLKKAGKDEVVRWVSIRQSAFVDLEKSRAGQRSAPHWRNHADDSPGAVWRQEEAVLSCGGNREGARPQRPQPGSGGTLQFAHLAEEGHAEARSHRALGEERRPAFGHREAPGGKEPSRAAGTGCVERCRTGREACPTSVTMESVEAG